MTAFVAILLRLDDGSASTEHDDDVVLGLFLLCIVVVDYYIFDQCFGY